MGRNSEIVVTIDLDWASEYAISKTLTYFLERQIPITVFSTHDSKFVADQLGVLEVGLHPFFSEMSSHGADEVSVAEHVIQLPHNIKAFRCHRFQCSNLSYSLMKELGFRISSNVCSDLEVVSPFKNRFQMLEVPIFMEDGGYLYNRYSMNETNHLLNRLETPGLKVLIIHPMHFSVNTPHWEFMLSIKQRMSRKDWINLTGKQIKSLEYHGTGIRDVMKQLISANETFTTIGELSNRYQFAQS